MEKPFVSLVAGTHPDTFWNLIGDDALAISSGFVNRLAPFVVEKGRSLPITQEPDPKIGEELAKQLQNLTHLAPRELSLADDARERWIEFSTAHDKQLDGLWADQAAVTKRVRDHVARLALVFAVDAGADSVRLPDLEAAIEVGKLLKTGFDRLLLSRQANYGPARASHIEEIIRRLLGKRPSSWHSARDLLRSWPNANRPSSEELRRVIRAVDGVEVQPPNGNRKERYRVATALNDTRRTTRKGAESKEN